MQARLRGHRWSRGKHTPAPFKCDKFIFYDRRGDAVLERLHQLRDLLFHADGLSTTRRDGGPFVLPQLTEALRETPAERLEGFGTPHSSAK